MKTFVLKVDLNEEDDGRWSVSITDLPGCSSWGYSRQEALENIKDAAEIYMEDKVYRHDDGRRVVIHYHHAKDTLPPGTLHSFLQGTKWNENDLERLGLK